MNGSIEVTGNLIYQSPEHSVRLVFIFVKYDLIIFGTSNGQILKVKINSFSTILREILWEHF